MGNSGRKRKDMETDIVRCSASFTAGRLHSRVNWPGAPPRGLTDYMSHGSSAAPNS